VPSARGRRIRRGFEATTTCGHQGTQRETRHIKHININKYGAYCSTALCAVRYDRGIGKHGFDWCLFWETPHTPHAPRDVPLTRARTVATNVLEENMLMIDRITKDIGFDCAVPMRVLELAQNALPWSRPLSSHPSHRIAPIVTPGHLLLHVITSSRHHVITSSRPRRRGPHWSAGCLPPRPPPRPYPGARVLRVWADATPSWGAPTPGGSIRLPPRRAFHSAPTMTPISQPNPFLPRVFLRSIPLLRRIA
jgi:hypothetical protein